MNKKFIILIILILLLIIGGAFWLGRNTNTEKRQSESFNKSEEAQSEEKTTSILSLFSQKGESLDKDKKIVSEIITDFFEAIKKREKLDSYWIDLASQKDKRSQESICNMFNQYKTEVTYDILQRATINKIIRELDRYDKVRVQGVKPTGSSYMDVKVCDKEGLCKFFDLDIEQKEDGNWMVDLGDNDLIEQEDVKDIHQTTTKEPWLAVKEFLIAFKNKEYAKVVDLLDDERFKSYKDKGDAAAGEALKRSYVNQIIKISDYLSFDKIEILSEDTEESMSVKTVLWEEGGPSEEKSFSLIKTQEGDWKIAIGYVHCINEEELNL